jgi:hypothetical protein
MADSSLLSVKIFQEPSKVLKIFNKLLYIILKVLSNRTIKFFVAITFKPKSPHSARTRDPMRSLKLTSKLAVMAYRESETDVQTDRNGVHGEPETDVQTDRDGVQGALT